MSTHPLFTRAPKQLACPPSPRRRRLVTGASVAAVTTAMMTLAAGAAVTSASLNAGDSLNVTCNGSVRVAAQNATQMQLACDPNAAPTPYSTAVTALPGLTLWAPMDESSGTVAHDFGPRRSNGTISSTGVAYRASDTVSGAASGRYGLGLAPSAGQVTFPHAPSLNLSTNATSAWLAVLDVRVDSLTGYPTLLSKGDRATNGFELFADPALNAVGLIVNGKQYAWGGVSFSTTKHLAVQFDGTSLSFWVNGSLLGRSTPSAATITDTGALRVGATGGVTVSKLAVAGRTAATAPSTLFTALTAAATTTTTAAPTTAAPTTAAPTTAAPTTTAAPPTTAAPTTSTTKAPTTTTTAPASGAKLLWSDEFNGPAGSGIDPAMWEQQVGAPTNNGRLEYLTDGTHNVAQDGKGNLVITARRESYNGRSYTSGRLESLKSFTTGYLEFRAKVPTWQGTMPGLWTYGAAGYGAQTGFSEIDALEIQTANDIDPTAVRQTIHGGMPDNSVWQLGWSQNRVDYAPNRPGDAWHTFGAYVNPTDRSVTFYADGVARTRYTPGQQPTGGVWPYGTYAQKAIVEIEMGGYSRTPTTDMNSDTLQVDYVRVYDKPPM